MLREIISATKLPPQFCASLVGVTSEQFKEWLDGTKPVPSFVIPELCTVLGVPKRQITASGFESIGKEEKLAPAVWYKLRDERLSVGDREMVGLVRKLGFFLEQLQTVRGGRIFEYAPLFGTVRESVDRTAPPSAQGVQAAQAFRSASGLQHGQAGIGELIRGYFRKIGILLIESPLKVSILEGCCFGVGSGVNPTPCIFANSFNSTWFRRNAVLMHELCHAIFDLEDDPVSIDFINDREDAQPQLHEARAQAFAQECLIPKSVLVQFVNRFGIRWGNLSVRDLGRLVASTHVEQKLLLTAALEAGFIERDQWNIYSSYSCAAEIREHSDHALTTREYLKRRVGESPQWVAEKRNTEVGTRRLRLPVRYVDEIIKALNDGIISPGKAAEMSMMEKRTFLSRFHDLINEPS